MGMVYEKALVLFGICFFKEILKQVQDDPWGKLFCVLPSAFCLLNYCS
jgi:hypothetical protein